jgi:hypothetical protein
MNVEFSYSDTDFLPIFLFANVGYEQYPSAKLFSGNRVLHFHTNALPVNVGARYYFALLLENIVLPMPIVQASASYTYSHTLIEYDEEYTR